MIPSIKVLHGGHIEAMASGYNAENSIFGGIKIWDGINQPVAVLAQELYEWQYKVGRSLIALAVTVAVTAVCVALFGTIGLLAFVPAFAVGAVWSKLGRNAELTSHMIEVLAAVEFYGVPFEGYLYAEAAGMIGGYSHLKGMTADEIREGMLARKGPAIRWLNKRRAFLAAWHAKLGAKQ